jgi:hypothetical protein
MKVPAQKNTPREASGSDMIAGAETVEQKCRIRRINHTKVITVENASQ